MTQEDTPQPTTDQPGQGQGQKMRVAVDESSMTTSYANAFRANATAEEVVVDFGVNLAAPSGGTSEGPEVVFQITNRIILNYYSAKRLAITMGQIIRNHEQQYGELELDAAKRSRKQ